MHRIVLFGNSGSGKSTMARALSREYDIPHLDLDSLAWATPGVRKPVQESAAAIHAFLAANEQWVVEGCYGDLLQIAIADATEIRLLNPGLEVCVANCRARPWEPEKYSSREAQDAMLEFLVGWVRDYESRTDEYSLIRHRQLYDTFPGRKAEITSPRDASG